MTTRNHAAHGTLHPLQPGQIESIVREAHELAQPLSLNVAEDREGIHSGHHQFKLAGMDLAAYRSRVQSVLEDLLERSAALQKIRAGEPTWDPAVFPTLEA